MAIITWPSLGIREISWTLDQPAQVNRSAYTGARSVAANPWHGKWSAKVTLATMQGEASFLAARAFFASLQGQVNTFALPATEGPQYVGINYPVIDAAAQGATTLALGNLGSELVTNGTFASTTTGWAASGSTLSVVSGKLRVTNSGAAQGLANQDIPVTIGQTYRFYAEAYSGTSSGTAFVTNTTGGLSDYGAVSTSGGVVYFTATTNSVRINCVVSSSVSSQYADFDNISLKAVTAPPLLAGHYATVSLPSGNLQMVMVTANASGLLKFVPALREAVSPGITPEAINPTCLVALDQSSFSWDVAQWRQYGMSFNVDEAF